jgi:hypothetical protein
MPTGLLENFNSRRNFIFGEKGLPAVPDPGSPDPGEGRLARRPWVTAAAASHLRTV